jgi:hypothetical protein
MITKILTSLEICAKHFRLDLSTILNLSPFSDLSNFLAGVRETIKNQIEQTVACHYIKDIQSTKLHVRYIQS